jgi:hypothetical protein
MENNIKKVYIGRKCFEINVDIGIQDVAWLATSVCYTYGLASYPVSRFLPCIARNKNQEILHPKLTICKHDKLIGDEIYVKIRPDAQDINSEPLNKDEIDWMENAFGKSRFKMLVTIK